MTDTEKREPRVWHKGDDEPTDVREVAQLDGPIAEEDYELTWIKRTDDWKGPWMYALSWRALLDQLGAVYEVFRDDEGTIIPTGHSSPPAVPSSGVQGDTGEGEAASGDLKALEELLVPVLDSGLSVGPEQDARACAKALLEAGWMLATEPRVFFDGDKVPPGVPVVFEDRSVMEPADAGHELWVDDGNEPAVELVMPSPEEFAAIVDRARAARTEGEGQ